MSFSRSNRVVFTGLVFLMSCAAGVRGFAQLPKSVITLEPETRLETQAEVETAETQSFKARLASHPDFRAFGDAHVGAQPEMKTLTLRFSAATRLTKFTSTPDFRIEPGSQCMEGKSFEAGDSCTLLVSFTPQGAGRRSGKVTVEHTASVTPMAFGLTGNGYVPVISFTPSVISTVPGTFVANKGLLSGAQNLAVDHSDTLYLADTGNNAIRYMDSSGTITALTSNVSGPYGVAVDTFGEIFFTEPSSNTVNKIFDYSSTAFQTSGTGTDACDYTATTTCYLYDEKITNPQAMAMDSSDQLFVTDSTYFGAVVFNPQTYVMTRIANAFYYQTSPNAFAVDAYGNSYTGWLNGECQIMYESYNDAYENTSNYQKVAGGRLCGFSGDGGEAGNAEIGKTMGQIAFDVAGNLYFSDTSNQRVRRIDASTGIINTIAGTGGAGWSGDGGPATSAQLSSPTGVGVDSQGQVYIISNAPAANSGQLVRKTGPNGALSFSNQVKGTVSAAKPLTIANTGNSVLNISKAVLAIGNSGDFAVDPNTTSCDLSGAGALQSGQSCKVGVIFKPAATGLRSASLVFLDNTVTNSNTVLLTGTGVLPSATMAITSPAAGSSFTSGTAVKFAVSVTSTGTAPTGTVAFLVDGKAYGSAVTLVSGAASTSVTGLTTASHTLSATYSGDANYAPGGPVSETITVTAAAAKAKATVALSAISSRTAFCPVSSWTATVAGPSSGAMPTGAVTLMDGTKVMRSSDLSEGRAAMGEIALSEGSHLLSVSYSGDANYAGATSPVYKATGSSCGGRVNTPVLVPKRTVLSGAREDLR